MPLALPLVLRPCQDGKPDSRAGARASSYNAQGMHVWQLVPVLAWLGYMPTQREFDVVIGQHAERRLAIGVGHVGVVPEIAARLNSMGCRAGVTNPHPFGEKQFFGKSSE